MFAGCRCPRCSDATLTVAKVEGRKVLGCPHCCGAFVGAELGLRLLATLDPDVPPPRLDIPLPNCPVCRKGMRTVVAAGFDVETCKVHGVWFDAGDLTGLVTAVAEALGKEIPSALSALEAKRAAQGVQTTGVQALPQTQRRPPSERSDVEIALDIAGEAVNVVTAPFRAVADVVMFPFEVVGLLGELVD